MNKLQKLIPAVCFVLIFQSIQIISTSAEPKLQAVLPCAVSNQLPCLDSITATDSNGRVVKAIMLPNSRKYPMAFAGQVTSPVDNFEWQIPGTRHENGNDRVAVNVMYFPYGAKYCWLENSCASGVDEIILNMSGAWWDKQPAPTEFPGKSSNKMCGTRENPADCIRGWGNDTNFEYSFNIKIAEEFSFSHANGEARNGSIREWRNSKNEKILTFSGKPVELSFVFTTDINPNTIFTQQRADVTFTQLSAYIQSSRSDQSKWLERCNYGKGMSLWYSGQLMSFPQWFPEDGSVGIGLASTHLRADGTENVGAFNIAMPLDTAKCLWGVDLSKSISASISALYEGSKTTEVVTTTTSVSNGFFNVNASGFHFSSPNFRVKLKQEIGVEEPTKQSKDPVLAPTPAASKKYSIVCIKGKLIQKVTSVNPKCPTGYKKR